MKSPRAFELFFFVLCDQQAEIGQIGVTGLNAQGRVGLVSSSGGESVFTQREICSVWEKNNNHVSVAATIAQVILLYSIGIINIALTQEC